MATISRLRGLGLPGLGLSPTLNAGGGVPWYDPAATLDADFANGRFRWNGVSYTEEAAFLAAIGGSKSGITRTIGPYVDASGTDLVTNGAFTTDAAGWGGLNSGIITSVAGEGSLEANAGVNPSFRQQVAMTQGKAYRYRGTIRRGTAPAAVVLISGNDASLNSSLASASNNTDTPVVTDLLIAWQGAAMNLGGRITSGSGSGAGKFDDLTAKEAVPFLGMVSLAVSGKVDGVTPAAASGSKVALQLWGSPNERNRVRLEYDASSHLQFIVTTNNVVQASLDLGIVPVSTAFAVEFTVADSRIAARLNSDTSLSDNSSIKPGLAMLSVARSQTGETWDGAISSVKIYATERLPTDMFYLEGDSYVAGAGGVSLTASLASAASRGAFTTGQGGSDLASQASRVATNPGLCRGVFVHWDGDANGFGTLAADMALYASMVAALGHTRFIIVPPCQRANGSTKNAPAAALQAALMAQYGATHVVDAQAILAGNATSPGDDATVAAGQIPASLLQGDGTHLTSTGMGFIATAIAALIISNGW